MEPFNYPTREHNLISQPVDSEFSLRREQELRLSASHSNLSHFTGRQIFINFYQRPEAFDRFSKLPAEIRLAIWEYAVPDPRSVHGAITVLVNFQLNSPRAILPSLKQMKKVYQQRSTLSNGRALVEPPDFLKDSLDQDAISQLQVLSLLHACSESRATTLKTYYLDFESASAGEACSLWDPETDMLYVSSDYAWCKLSALGWISLQRESPLPIFANVQHLALPVCIPLLRTMRLSFGLGGGRFDCRWLENFPSLNKLSLIYDPAEVGQKEEGTGVLCGCENTPVRDLVNRTPLFIELGIRQTLRTSEAMKLPGKALPVIESFVLCWEKPKQ